MNTETITPEIEILNLFNQITGHRHRAGKGRGFKGTIRAICTISHQNKICSPGRNSRALHGTVYPIV